MHVWAAVVTTSIMQLPSLVSVPGRVHRRAHHRLLLYTCLLVLDQVSLGQSLDGADIARLPVLCQEDAPKAACAQDGARNEVSNSTSIIRMLWTTPYCLDGRQGVDEDWRRRVCLQGSGRTP